MTAKNTECQKECSDSDIDVIINGENQFNQENEEMKSESNEMKSISKIIEKMKIALTFLLNKDSKIFQQNEQIQEHEIDEIDENIMNKLYVLSNYKSLNKTWNEWKLYKNIDNNIDDLIDFNDEELQYLEDESDHFLDEQHDLIECSSQSLIQTLTNSFTKSTPKQISIRKNPHFYTLNIQKYGSNSLYSDEELEFVSNKKKMNEWITKYKSNINHIKSNKYSDIKMDHFMPMNVWNWKNVVSFIESMDEFKYFASIFWEYQINGKELMKMKRKQIELLLEHSFLNNSQFLLNKENEVKFENVKSKSTEISKLVCCIHKARIQSHVISRYYLTMDVLHNLVNKKYETIINEAFYDDAKMIFHLIQSFRSFHSGPKTFWKMDAIFFNKIDNYLSVLICDEHLFKMYQISFPDFLCEEDLNEFNHFNHLNEEEKEKENQQIQCIIAPKSDIVYILYIFCIHFVNYTKTQ